MAKLSKEEKAAAKEEAKLQKQREKEEKARAKEEAKAAKQREKEEKQLAKKEAKASKKKKGRGADDAADEELEEEEFEEHEAEEGEDDGLLEQPQGGPMPFKDAPKHEKTIETNRSIY